MFDTLPKSYEVVKDWSWEQFEPFANNLLERELTDELLDGWMQDYSNFLALIAEAHSRAYVAHSCDTADEEAEKRYLGFTKNILPPATQAQNALDQKLVESGLEPDHFDMPLKKMKVQIELFREENLPLIVEERKLSSEYDKLSGGQTVQFEGEELPLRQLDPVYMDNDRERREKAWRLEMGCWLGNREAYNDIWVKLLALRREKAANAGLPDYRAFMWKERLRFDYTPDDCQTFRDAIEAIVVPAAQRRYENRRQRLGIDRVRPWDVLVDPSGLEPLRPFKDSEELVGKAANIFDRVDPVLGKYFATMRDRNLLDLDNRKGKAPGGYCTRFLIERVPFIFMNSVGIHDNVQTLLHEAGHAFHGFETSNLPYVQQMNYPIEFAEVASMSMELLAAPYLTRDQGGYYSEQEAARARLEHLETIITFLPYMSVVDGFQHWVYLNADDAMNPAKCDEKWGELWGRFMKFQDWSGLEDAMMTGWHRKLHIFKGPFYYVDYGLAQMGAVQVWANSLKDQAAAVQQYRSALALGGTAPLPDLFQAAGVKFGFDHDTVKAAVDLIEKTMDELEAAIG